MSGDTQSIIQNAIHGSKTASEALGVLYEMAKGTDAEDHIYAVGDGMNTLVAAIKGLHAAIEEAARQRDVLTDELKRRGAVNVSKAAARWLAIDHDLEQQAAVRVAEVILGQGDHYMPEHTRRSLSEVITLIHNEFIEQDAELADEANYLYD